MKSESQSRNLPEVKSTDSQTSTGIGAEQADSELAFLLASVEEIYQELQVLRATEKTPDV